VQFKLFCFHADYGFSALVVYPLIFVYPIPCRDMSTLYLLEMGPDPTWAYFWRAVNERLTCLEPGYFLTSPAKILFDFKEKTIFRWYFPNPIPKMRMTRPNPSNKILTWPRPITNIYHLSGFTPCKFSVHTKQISIFKWVSSRSLVNLLSFFSQSLIFILISCHKCNKDARKVGNVFLIISCTKWSWKMHFPFYYSYFQKRV